MHHVLRGALFVTAALGFAFAGTGSAGAASFQVAPMGLFLTQRERVGSITVTNPNDAPLRLEVQAYRWTQGVDGQSSLDPSDALLVFPQLLIIPSHGQRNLRVASTESLGEIEATYRVSISEIASFSAPATRGAQIAIQMQVNLPVFIAPLAEHRAAMIAAAKVHARTLTFDVANRGTVHFITKDVRVTGIGPDTRPLFSQAFDGGDVLADGKRQYRMDLPNKECAALRALTIKVKTDAQQLIETLAVPAGACGP